jgi:hypothetical protein
MTQGVTRREFALSASAVNLPTLVRGRRTRAAETKRLKMSNSEALQEIAVKIQVRAFGTLPCMSAGRCRR